MGSSPSHLVVLAGPNGAGKSTAAPRILQGALKVQEFVDADVIARGLSGFQPGGAAIPAGRVMMERLKSLAARGADFAFETTLASRTFAPWIRRLIHQGYELSLAFLWLPSADMAVRRVRERVRAGGHSVPEETIRRRYESGLKNFFRIYSPLASNWRFYENSTGKGPRLLASGKGSNESVVKDSRTWETIKTRYEP